MSEWKTYKLGEIADINPRVPLKQGNEYSFVEMKDLDATLKYVKPSAKKELKGGSKFQEHDTLFARITPCLENGKICQVKGLENGVGFGSTEFMIFRGKEDLSDTDFIYYLTRTEYVRNNAIQAMTGSSGRQRVEKSALEKIDVIVPELNTQKSIASILSSLDDKIELNLQMNQTLEKMAQAIFNEWFVKFNFLGFDGELVDGLPKGWEIGKFSDLAEIFSGKGLKREEFIKDGHYSIMGANGEIGRANKYLYDDDLILTGRVGTLGVVNISNGKRWISDNVLISKPFRFFYYSFHVLKSYDLKSLNRGSTQPLITQTDLKNQVAILPLANICERFEDCVKPFYRKIFENILQNNTLTELRDNLLPKLMTGKLEIKN